MKANLFSRALGNISESYVDEAVTYASNNKRKTWIKWASVAACVSLIFASALLLHIFRSPDTSGEHGPITSYFVITALAADGEPTDLTLNNGFLNSVPAQGENIFGVDMPLFNFSVTPSDLNNNETIYERFDISISYNGSTVTVTDKDEHIFIAYIYNRNSSGGACAWSVMGWFTEPTDVIVHIIDKETRAIVETITVNVNYLANKQEYELKVTNLTTLFSEQKEAVLAHNYLMVQLFREGYVTDYPEWFGGCYIEGNKLHIRLVSSTDDEIKTLKEELASFGNVVVYENAEISMSNLQEYADKTANALIENGYAVTSWYVDSVTGNIVISVLEKDLDAASVWVNVATKNENLPKIIMEAGNYVELDSQAIEFTAEPFIQHVGLSWMYSMNVRIDNGKIYLDGYPYDMTYTEDYTLNYSATLAPGPYANDITLEELYKLRSQRGCYILEADGESKYGERLIMYVIDDTYYFIRFFENGEIMRIHSGTAK